MDLLSKIAFDHIEIDNDDVISDILVRNPLLRRVSKEELISFVMTHIKPLLGPEEVLQVDVEVNVFLSNVT